MILAQGEILPPEQADSVIGRLPEWMAFSGPPPEAEAVIAACDELSQRVARGEYEAVTRQVVSAGMVTRAQIDSAVRFFSRESLDFKWKTELGAERFPVSEQPPGSAFAIRRRLIPLGVLLHIAAGNVDALPAYSVIEGLLAGNVNLLKLPQADAGLSVLLLAELIGIEPRLKPFVYVFDTPSSDLETMQKLAGFADGIVVWGGDEAITAARRLAAPNTRVIEWGHKLSFAYATQGASDEALAGLARQIAATRQLLCSSCQGIFLDTEDLPELHRFCERFLPILEGEAASVPPVDRGTQAKITLQQYTERLEGRPGKRLFAGKNVTLTAAEDSALELSLLYGNCWVKRLPRRKLVSSLRPYKGYLQTAGLLCAPEEWEPLSELLLRAGICRVRTGENMSVPMAGEAHDGEFALRRYAKVAEVEVGIPENPCRSPFSTERTHKLHI